MNAIRNKFLISHFSRAAQNQSMFMPMNIKSLSPLVEPFHSPPETPVASVQMQIFPIKSNPSTLKIHMNS